MKYRLQRKASVTYLPPVVYYDQNEAKETWIDIAASNSFEVIDTIWFKLMPRGYFRIVDEKGAQYKYM